MKLNNKILDELKNTKQLKNPYWVYRNLLEYNNCFVNDNTLLRLYRYEFVKLGLEVSIESSINGGAILKIIKRGDINQ